METLFWKGGTVQDFRHASLQAFTKATVQPSLAVMYYADEILKRQPQKTNPGLVYVQLVASNFRWSVYCLNYKAVLAVSAVADETLDLHDLSKNQLLQLCIPLPKSP